MILLTTLLVSGGLAYLGHTATLLIQKKKSNIKLIDNSKLPPSITTLVPTNSIQSDQDDDEKRDKRYLTVSFTSLGIATGAALFYPALGMISIVGLAYVSIPFFKNAYVSLFKEKRVRIAVLDSTLALVCIINGYYVAWSLICSLIYGGRSILRKVEHNSRESLLNVFDQQVDKVWIYVEGVEVEVALQQLKKDDLVVVHAGETIPIDGLIFKGDASVDQHLLTGESQPAEKMVDDTVLASSLVLAGKIIIKVQQTGASTAAARITNILAQTADYKASLQSRGEMYSDKAALPTLILSTTALMTVGPTAGLTVLNSAFAFYMRILGPIGMLNYLKQAFHQGLLIKDGRVLDLLGQVDMVVFDKTGTLTHAQPHVGTIYTYADYDQNEVLQFAATAEYKQNHPIALAILQETRLRQLELPIIDDTHYQIGYGLTVRINGYVVHVGSIRFMTREGITVPKDIHDIQQQSHSLIMVAVDHILIGMIEMLPTVRKEAKAVIEWLHQAGISTAIISGDHITPTRKIANMLGIDTYFAETLPEKKADIISQLQDEGRFVSYIGDGINDAIALKKAQVSISFNGASSVATDTAQVILMNDNLQQIIQLFELANTFDERLKQTLTYSIMPGVITVGGAFFLHFGLIYSIILNQLGFTAGILTMTKSSKKVDYS